MRCLILLLGTAFSLHATEGLRWVQEGPRATWSVQGAGLRTSGLGNISNWIRTEGEYENFVLRFEYKLAQWAEAAVYVRAPRSERPGEGGLAISLCHDFHKLNTPYVTGAIRGIAAPRKLLPESFGVWHRAMVEVREGKLRVSIDDEVLQDVVIDDVPAMRTRMRRGHIGFPDLGHAYEVRNVQIEALPDSTKVVSLFNGRDLDGWKLRGAGNWRVRDGAIEGANGHGILYAPPLFRDFELSLVVRSHSRVNGGVFLRGSADEGKHRGFEVQIYSPVESVYPTGSIYAKQRASVSADLEERWFLMQIRVEGARCAVRIDGELVAEYASLQGADLEAGQVGLQIHMDNASVEFRDVRVRELSSTASLTPGARSN
jgi:hypothetical protein